MIAAFTAAAQVTHYRVELRPDFESKVIRGVEEIEVRGAVVLQHEKALHITKLPSGVTESGDSIKLAGPNRARFEFEARSGKGLRWLDGDAGFVTMFHCGAWMVCDPSPSYRATIRLEFVLPSARRMRAVGPGRLVKRRREGASERFVYEVRHPAQSFLFSFAVAPLEKSVESNFEIWSAAPGHREAFAKSAEAYRFLREKAGVDWPDPRYTQTFAPLRGAGQEAASMAIMSEAYLAQLEGKDSVELMAHEMAHQWWAALVGIRSWSDFWLNEGIAEFMTAAFVEQHHGRAAYDAKLAGLRAELDKLRAAGRDRPLHWEQWKDAVEALGPVPYVKGALFLDRLRTELGAAAFWRGLAIYTRRHAGSLVDSRDFQRAMEEASGRSLAETFEEGVYR